MPALKPLLAAACVAAAATLAACGDSEPEPTLSPEQAETLNAQLDEIQENIDVGSCFVASDRAEGLLTDIEALPDDVDSDLKRGLENGVNQLIVLLNTDECEAGEGETTTEETTTEETTTEETQTTETTETQPTETQEPQPQPQPPPTNPGGGVGPPGSDGL